MKRKTALAFVLVALTSLPLLGCDKIKGAMGKSDEGGVSTSGGSGGALSALSILNGFEGEIDLTVKGKSLHASAPVNVALEVKGDKVRADLPQGLEGADKLGKASIIWDTPGQKIFVILDAQKQVIVLDLSKTGEQLKAMKPGGPHPHGGGGGAGGAVPSSPPPKITKTGKTDKVAGYTCEIWTIENSDPNAKEKDKGKAELCIAEQGVSWFHIPMTGVPAEYSFMSELMDGKHFPLRAIMYDAANVEEGRVEITKIDKKTLDAKVFVPPADYAQMDVAQAMGAMMGGMGGPGMGPGMGGPHGGRPIPHPIPPAGR
jgi:hypothetical protein